MPHIHIAPCLTRPEKRQSCMGFFDGDSKKRENDKIPTASETALAQAILEPDADISSLLTQCVCGSTSFAVSKKVLRTHDFYIESTRLGDESIQVRLASCVGCKRAQCFLVAAPARLDFEIVDIAEKNGYR